MLLIAKVIGNLIVAGLEILGEQALRLINRHRRRRESLPEVDVRVSDPPQPLTHQAIEHQRAQMNASIAASKKAERAPTVDRNAPTVPPSKPDKLPE